MSQFTTASCAKSARSPRRSMKYKKFIFGYYNYNPAQSTLLLQYRYSGGPQFEEKLIFDFVSRPLSPADNQVLDRLFRLIFLLSGVSYYKAFIPKLLTCEAFPLDEGTAEFLHKFYLKGLAEFAFRNGISLRDHFRFRFEPAAIAPPMALDLPERTCVPVGGGKDSIVTIECLRQAGEPLVLFSLGSAAPIEATIAQTGLPAIRVKRSLDPTLFALNEAGALNGHVPITGILSLIVV